jgi:hypothetical protein
MHKLLYALSPASLLDPSILLSTLFSDTLTDTRRDLVSHPYKSKSKIIVFIYFNL